MTNPITTAVNETTDKRHGDNQKYIVNIEGTEHPWPRDTITTEEIAKLGSWETSQGVLEVDKDNNERTLKPDEVIELKPGHGFAKKVRWKRGENAIQIRIGEELAILRSRFPRVDYVEVGQWARVHNYRILQIGWSAQNSDVIFQIPVTYPGTRPYGVYVPAGLRYQGNMPANYQEPASNQPPFEGNWGFFSWEPADGEWRPTTNIVTGANLLNFVLGFNDRFREGV